ncbi:hydroxymethylglutaryl-CoA lyase [Methylocystis echinoides]|uniref:hydroxymethylglutaryl-CoA lyase n=1 Tax=Methylocystis echinoides TaxID=29468 RepID=A0A9W6GRW6_9HYPH|nr:hydroxymethylglutaryl-CoA lyase [Methylocystis echinoides]GLI91889.1 hydroxymethylglutaryl-CoA lyase [Methylocystis echinoides]
MSNPRSVRLVEVGPRDGLQSEPVVAPVEVRAQLIEKLAAAGLEDIEVGSFVSERTLPQMAGTGQLMKRLDALRGVRLSALAPNLRGFQDAKAAGAPDVAVLTAASESFSRRNLNCSIDESLERVRAVVEAARAGGVSVRAYISCVLGCPYEGRVDVMRVAEIAGELHRIGCREISLGDTIGVGAPFAARAMVEKVARAAPIDRLAGHFHDTYGQALANIFACLEVGVGVFDCAIGGLGGCPFAPGASGNVATEDVVYMLRDSRFDTGVDLDGLRDAASFICDFLGRPPQSRVGRACAAKQVDAVAHSRHRHVEG